MNNIAQDREDGNAKKEPSAKAAKAKNILSSLGSETSIEDLLPKVKEKA